MKHSMPPGVIEANF